MIDMSGDSRDVRQIRWAHDYGSFEHAVNPDGAIRKIAKRARVSVWTARNSLSAGTVTVPFPRKFRRGRKLP